MAWLDRAGHESDRETAPATYPGWLHNRLRDCARETHRRLVGVRGRGRGRGRGRIRVRIRLSPSPSPNPALDTNPHPNPKPNAGWVTSGARWVPTAEASGRPGTRREG